jgi:menaquinone-dependent protoporphyrinogen IX oxidase
MERRVLVAFPSKHGSTGEVAEAITDTLRELGHRVDEASRLVQERAPLETAPA